jgi:mannose-6-phosphate isomerase-like protein (cupin superfamily)
MKSKNCKLTDGFRVAFDHGGVQAAEMVIAPGDKEGGPDNRHQGADQWLVVIDGSGTAVVEGSRRQLRRGSLLLIEKGERHEIRNTGNEPLTTLNFYSPPAYDAEGSPRAAGKSREGSKRGQ